MYMTLFCIIQETGHYNLNCKCNDELTSNWLHVAPFRVDNRK